MFFEPFKQQELHGEMLASLSTIAGIKWALYQWKEQWDDKLSPEQGCEDPDVLEKWMEVFEKTYVPAAETLKDYIHEDSVGIKGFWRIYHWWIYRCQNMGWEKKRVEEKS